MTADRSTQPSTTSHSVTVRDIGPVQVTCTEQGAGRPHLLLHGGAGPASMTPIADLLAERAGARVITPVHPGFAGTARPAALTSVRGLATVYTALLHALDLDEVTVVGNSLGGWIAAEIAALGSPRLREVVLVDAAGLSVPDHPTPDVSSLTRDEITELSYHDPGAFRVDVTALPPQARAAMAANGAALAGYGGTTMTDPTLTGRLGAVTIPTLVVWGEADRMIDPAVGRAYAAALPGARFVLLPGTGHLPQLETPEALLHAITG